MNQDHCIETGAEEASRETIDKQATLGCDLIKALIFENGKIKDEFRWGFHLIGYSQGGLIARYLFEICDPVRPYVVTLTTDGTPNLGTERIPHLTDFGPAKQNLPWWKRLGYKIVGAGISMIDFFAKMSTGGKLWSFTQYLYKKNKDGSHKLTDFLVKLNKRPEKNYAELELVSAILYLDERVITPRSSTAYGIDVVAGQWQPLKNIPDKEIFGFDKLLKDRRLTFCAAESFHLAMSNEEYAEFLFLSSDRCDGDSNNKDDKSVRDLYRECSVTKFEEFQFLSMKCTRSADRLVI